MTVKGRRIVAAARLLPAALILAAAGAPARTLARQLDPLRPFKIRQPRPNVLLLVDSSERMQFDADGTYYDPLVYRRTGADFELALGVSVANTETLYRRRFRNLRHVTAVPALRANAVEVAGDRDPRFARFDAAARLHVARSALLAALSANRHVARFGLLTTRHRDARLGPDPAAEVSSSAAGQQAPTDTGMPGTWLAGFATVAAPNGEQAGTPPLVAADASGGNERIAEILGLAPNQPGALVAAGLDLENTIDSPLDDLLRDARTEAIRLQGTDDPGNRCRNTVAILVTGGGEGTTAPSPDARATASSMIDVGGHRVPVYVLALAPPASDVASLQAVATASGGQYLEITAAMIARAVDQGTVPELVQAVNVAVQHAFADVADVDAAPSADRPFGRPSPQMVAGPVVATVNLAGARDAAGQVLPATVVTSPLTGGVVPQPANVLLNAGFAVPGDVGTTGFPGILAAYRTYKPVADAARPSGYRFEADGTALWTASTPASATRNIFTVLEDGTIVPFTASSATLLAPYLGVADPAALIDFVRRQPLGAIIDSSPAVLTPPALAPAPDADYQTFSARHASRRTLVFLGANDGMLHAFDARLGLEVWAFVPFNLLPRLRALTEGQAVGDFRFFVDASPRLADIRTRLGWRTVLVFGQGPGGNFYHALDVTLPGLEALLAPDADDLAALLAYFSRPGRVPLLWAFPRLASFDWARAPYGDLGPDASAIEKAMGDTWSDPLIAEVHGVPGRHVVAFGAGLLTYSQQRARFGDGSAPGAGTTFCLLDAETGQVLDGRDVGHDGQGETSDACDVAGDCARLRNGLVAAPAASTGDNARGVSAVYVGDLDGRLWRIALGAGADGGPAILGGPTRAYDAGPSHPIVSSVALTHESPSGRLLFVATGSDRLPAAASVDSGLLVGLAEAPGATSTTPAFVLPLAASGSPDSERVTGPPVIGADIVFFTTTTWTAQPCRDTTGSVYALAFGGSAAYDTNGDGRVDAGDRRLAVGGQGGRVTAPFVADRHVYLGTGRSVTVLGDPEGYNTALTRARLRVLTWREARQAP